MGIDGLDQVPSPPALEDAYDGLEELAGEGENHVEGWPVAGAISLILSVYGFWVGFAALKAWFSPGPYCTGECRRGIAYAVALLVPACLGVALGFALIRGRPWARPVGLAVFGAFALENLVRIDLSFRFTYRMLFLLMFVANCLGVAALLLPFGGSRKGAGGRSQTDFGRSDLELPSGRRIDPEGLGVSVQESATIGRRSASSLPLCPLVASILIIATTAWYRIPDSLLRKDFLGVFAYQRPPVPRWLAASPAVSALVIWGFLVAVGVAMRFRWARISALATAAAVGVAGLAYAPFAPTPWLRIESAGLVLGNAVIIGVLLSSRCRSETHE